MFDFEFSRTIEKRLSKLAKKNKTLADIFYKKMEEVISHNSKSIDTYKNLRSPKKEFKRIHLTDNFILLFKVNNKENLIIFIDIIHWDNAYD